VTAAALSRPSESRRTALTLVDAVTGEGRA
jgi:hypothetical protein